MEYAVKSKRGRSLSYREQTEKFERAWVEAGCPRDFRTDGGFRPLRDTRALRAALADREDPARVVDRLERHQLELRRQRLEQRR
jgi:hypothetical protein